MTSPPDREIPWWRSIRLRIAVAVAAVSVAMLCTVGAVVDYRAALGARDRLREQAVNRMEAATAVYQVTKGRLSGDATLSEGFAPSPVRSATRDSGDVVTFYDGSAMWVSERVGPQIVLTIKVPADSLHRERSQLRSALVTAGLPAVLLSALLGWMVATGLSRRLRRGAAAALSMGSSISADGPGIRAAVGGHDEVAALTTAVDEMARALGDRVRREREFSADVAHELRTPVTALVSSAELLGEDQISTLVRQQVTRLRRLVEDLLELFRSESGHAEVAVESWDLAEATATIIERLPVADQAVRLTVSSSAQVEVDPRRLERILGNLVTNAILHGGSHVEVGVAGTTLTVADDGPGYPDAVLGQEPRRFVRISRGTGSGLGLAIVASQTRLLGASLHLANRIDGGAVATVRFVSEGASPASAGPADSS